MAAVLALLASCTVEATDVPDAGAPPAIRLGLACECPDTYPCELAACGPGASCPGGTCTIACASDADCPAGAICTTPGVSGACLWACMTDDDCRDPIVSRCNAGRCTY